jgi:hypothetical protein
LLEHTRNIELITPYFWRQKNIANKSTKKKKEMDLLRIISSAADGALKGLQVQDDELARLAQWVAHPTISNNRGRAVEASGSPRSSGADPTTTAGQKQQRDHCRQMQAMVGPAFAQWLTVPHTPSPAEAVGGSPGGAALAKAQEQQRQAQGEDAHTPKRPAKRNFVFSTPPPDDDDDDEDALPRSNFDPSWTRSLAQGPSVAQPPHHGSRPTYPSSDGNSGGCRHGDVPPSAPEVRVALHVFRCNDSNDRGGGVNGGSHADDGESTLLGALRVALAEHNGDGNGAASGASCSINDATTCLQTATAASVAETRVAARSFDINVQTLDPTTVGRSVLQAAESELTALRASILNTAASTAAAAAAATTAAGVRRNRDDDDGGEDDRTTTMTTAVDVAAEPSHTQDGPHLRMSRSASVIVAIRLRLARHDPATEALLHRCLAEAAAAAVHVDLQPPVRTHCSIVVAGGGRVSSSRMPTTGAAAAGSTSRDAQAPTRFLLTIQPRVRVVCVVSLPTTAAVSNPLRRAALLCASINGVGLSGAGAGAACPLRARLFAAASLLASSTSGSAVGSNHVAAGGATRDAPSSSASALAGIPEEMRRFCVIIAACLSALPWLVMHPESWAAVRRAWMNAYRPADVIHALHAAAVLHRAALNAAAPAPAGVSASTPRQDDDSDNVAAVRTLWAVCQCVQRRRGETFVAAAAAAAQKADNAAGSVPGVAAAVAVGDSPAIAGPEPLDLHSPARLVETAVSFVSLYERCLVLRDALHLRRILSSLGATPRNATTSNDAHAGVDRGWIDAAAPHTWLLRVARSSVSTAGLALASLDDEADHTSAAGTRPTSAGAASRLRVLFLPAPIPLWSTGHLSAVATTWGHPVRDWLAGPAALTQLPDPSDVCALLRAVAALCGPTDSRWVGLEELRKHVGAASIADARFATALHQALSVAALRIRRNSKGWLCVRLD